MENSVSLMEPAAQCALLDDLFAAFNRHDVAGVIGTMTGDVVFEGAAGPDVFGVRFSGRAAVGEAFAKVFRDLPDVRWDDVQHYPAGQHAVSTWTMRATRPDGARIEVEGIDFFTLRDDKVSLKRAFRKDRPPLRL